MRLFYRKKIMTPNSLFNIILKLIVIFFLKNFFMELSVSFAFFNMNGDSSLLYPLIGIAGIFIYLLIIYGLLFQTNWIITKLALDKGFKEESFSLNLHRSVVLSIAIIIMGGLIVIEALPLFVQQLLNYIQIKKEKFVEAKFSYVILQF